jgi:hypothetical protein
LPMIVTIRTGWPTLGREMAKLVGGAIGLAASVARHVAWYVSHQVQPDPRKPS